MTTSHQSNIYVQNFLRARHYSFSAAYSELIGRLCAVEGAMTMRDTSLGFCEELMSAFRATPTYDKVDRICLVARVGLSNELMVYDSHNSRKSTDNLMIRGYSCFVRPDSSLFSLREGETRSYDEASRVAGSFKGRQKPVQRSLSYIMKMGFESGMCVPLHSSGLVRGFLFFNSVDSGLFTRLVDEDFAVLNVIAMIAKVALLAEMKIDDEYHSIRSEDFAHFSGTLFDEDEFALQLQNIVRWQTGELWRPTVKTEGNSHFLYSPTTLAFIVSKVCSAFYASPAEYPKQLTVISTDDGENSGVDVCVPMVDASTSPIFDKYRMKTAMLSTRLSFLRATLAPKINHVAVRIPFDGASPKLESAFYSV
jgi:hypothetical protein